MRRLIAVGMSFVVASSGCSFALVSGPPENHQQLPAFECTTSRVGPVLDTVWTALHTLNVALALTQDDAEWDDNFGGDAPFSRTTGMVLYGVFAALGGAGMWFGYTRTAECRDAKQQLVIRQSQQPPVGPATTWPPPPATVPPTPAPPVPETPAPPAP